MEISKNHSPIYTIQESGLISVPNWAEGRLIPAVVLNSRTDSNLKELLRIHVSTEGQGDVIVKWGVPVSQFFKPKVWVLNINFTKPMEYTFLIEFVLEKHYSLIDAIFQSRGLHVSYGFVGEKISKKVTDDIVLIEVPDTNYDAKWNNTLNDILKAKLRKQKTPRKDLGNEVSKQIKKMREILHYRNED